MSGSSPFHQSTFDDDVRPRSLEQDFFEEDGKKSYTDLVAECVSPTHLTELTPLSNQYSYASETMIDVSPYLPGASWETKTPMSWELKHPINWNIEDVALWIQHVATQCGLNAYSFQAERFNHCSGADLMQMSRDDFQRCDPNWGLYIYAEYQSLVNGNEFLSPTPEPYTSPSVVDTKDELVFGGHYYSVNRDDSFRDILCDSVDVLPSLPSLPNKAEALMIDEPVSPQSSCDSSSSMDVPRQRAHKGVRGNHLWEFIRDLLLDPSFSPSLIRWEDREQGVFKIVKSEQVANLWGKKKNNSTMTYEKMSRAMRFCKKMQWFADAPKTGRFPKKLCYKFGPKSHGWEAPRN